ncbi:MAG TPA: type 4a pilus biogenesis protein PilO [Methylomirabilota bacterium]|jgi:Tfp pilus assembly protein PilO|nr:type 4a pilus biogenesis protein PilO [Methylomirabilota bacterium]
MTNGIVLLIACFLAAYFLALPRWNKYQLSIAQLHDAQAQNDQLNQSLSSLQSFLDTYNSHAQDRVLASQALPTQNVDTADLLTGIDALAKASGVNLKSLELGSSSNSAAQKAIVPNSIVTQPITMTLDASYPAFKDFITRLQNHLRLIDIQSVSFKIDDAGLLQFDVILKTYYQQ